MDVIKILDKTFERYLSAVEIEAAVTRMAMEMNRRLAGKPPLFMCILNGAFMFAADLFRRITVEGAQISFIRLASYRGQTSTGAVQELIGLSEDIAGHTVVILEDIIDTGVTISYLMKQFQALNVAEVQTAALLFKPGALKCNVVPDYVGLEIPNDFIIGYGLDYDGFARNLPEIYRIKNTEPMLNIVLFGPPGAGKGTQAEFLIREFGLTHLSTGDLLRSEIAADTPLGRQAQTFMDKGELVPDAVVIGMIKHRIESHRDAHGFIFDGFPRTVKQAEELDRMLEELGIPVSGMLSLEVEKEELVSRLLNRGQTSGRSDDRDAAVIENRIQVYHEKTAPLKQYYANQGKHFHIDGMGAIEEIGQRLKAAIETGLKKLHRQ